MSQVELEIALAWEEVSFWQDFVMWWNSEHNKLPEPRIMAALENAWRRYERVLNLRQGSKSSDSETADPTAGRADEARREQRW
jgi:hypothetical protein